MKLVQLIMYLMELNVPYLAQMESTTQAQIVLIALLNARAAFLKIFA